MRIYMTVLKMTLAGIITSLISKALNLDYWITAGILAVLSTQLTKQDAFIIAGKRTLDTLLGLALAFIMFLIFGQHFWVYGIILLIFAYLSFVLKIQEGLVPVLVLIGHILEADSLAFKYFLNEFLIMMIAIVVVLILDLIIPKPKEDKFVNETSKIDELLKKHILLVSNFLKGQISKDEVVTNYSDVINSFNEADVRLTLLSKDMLFSLNKSFLEYLKMREQQLLYIHHIFTHSLKITEKHEHSDIITQYLDELSLDISYVDKATKQLEKLNESRQFFKTSPLPKTRIEFETRAMLFQVLNEIEYFLNVKIDFHKKNPNFYAG